MHVAILGATGAVGRTMLEVLDRSALPVARLTLLASPRSAGVQIEWRGEAHTVQAVGPDAFRGVDVALFSAGGDRSLEWAPIAAAAGATVIDNSSAWRMDPRVPLVVPEVNAAALADRPLGIVANPNCSTIQMVMALAPLARAAGLRRVVATTFQAAGGAGEAGRAALRAELAGGAATDSPFARRLAGNVIPQIGSLDDTGWTGEEIKMRSETRRILDLPDLAVVATCVRVPVDVGHSVQVMAELARPVNGASLAALFDGVPNLEVARAGGDYPTPAEVAGLDVTRVGRVRVDPDRPDVVHFWVVADNLRKGAATNAVQIAEALAGVR